MGCCQSPSNGYQTPKKKPLPKSNQVKVPQKQKQKKPTENQRPKINIAQIKQKKQIPKIMVPAQTKPKQQPQAKKIVQKKIMQNQQIKAVKLVIDENDVKVQVNQKDQNSLKYQNVSKIYIDVSSKIQPEKRNVTQIGLSDIPDLQMVTARKDAQEKIQEHVPKQDQPKYEICEDNYFDGSQFLLNLKQLNHLFIQVVNPQCQEHTKKQIIQKKQERQVT